MTAQPSAHDIAGWRAAIWAERDRDARAELVLQWALALGGLTVSEARQPLPPGVEETPAQRLLPATVTTVHLPHGLDPEVAGAIRCSAWLNAVALSVPRSP